MALSNTGSSHHHGALAGPSQSFGDKTVNTNVFAEVEYRGSRVYIYDSMANDVANKQDHLKWTFYYMPAFLPVNHNALEETNNWVHLTRYNKLDISLFLGNEELENKIREALAKKVSEASEAVKSSWTIKPLMIDSLTAFVVDEEDAVPGVKPCRVVNPREYEIALSFGFIPSVDEQFINEVVKRIQHGFYKIKLSIEFAGFSKKSQNVVSYSFKSIQDAVSNTLADGPSTPKYILRSQKTSFAQHISNKLEETVFTEIKDKPIELERLRSMFAQLIEMSLSKAQEVKVEMGQLANVWSADDLKPDFIESEVNKLFKHKEAETDNKKDGEMYFELDKSNLSKNSKEKNQSKGHDVNLGGEVGAKMTGVKFIDGDANAKGNIGYKYTKSSGENFVNELHDQVKNTNKDKFSESEIKKLLDKNNVEIEWKGQKFVTKSIRVIKIADIVQNINQSLVSKQIELEKEKATSIMMVNHKVIIDSEIKSILSPRLNTIYRNLVVRVYSITSSGGGDESSNTVLYFVPLMQPARDEYSPDNNTGWIRAVSSNQINIQLIQYSQQLKQEIKKKVEASSGEGIQPFVIDSLTARIKHGKFAIDGVESYLISRPSENIITLQFKVSSSSSAAQEIVNKILSQEYSIEVYMWLQLPSGPKSSQVLSSPIVRIVNTDAPISFESSPLFSGLQEKVTYLENKLKEVYRSLPLQFDSIVSGTQYPEIAVLKQLGYLAAGHDSSIGIRIYDLQSKQLVRSIPTSSYINDLKPFQENKLIQASRGGKINIWNVETGQLVTALEGHSGRNGRNVNVIALNKNESRMLSCGEDNKTILWDMVNYSQIRTFKGYPSEVFTVVFHEAKSQVIGGSKDGTIRVWDMNDGSLVKEQTAHSNWVRKLVLDESTGLLYSASWDKTIKQWNVESGECLKTLTGHTSAVKDLILNQESGWLASASHDKSIIIWDKQTGSIINRLHYTEGLCGLALSPLNGQQLISTSYGGNILFWYQKVKDNND